MIHVITIHHHCERWIKLQHRYLNKHVQDCKVWAYIDRIPEWQKHQESFHFAKPSGKLDLERCTPGHEGSRNHWTKLNKLTSLVIEDSDTKEDDILVWLDSDAFPLVPLNPFIEAKLEKFPFVAVQRPENLGDKYPHPSFACSTVKFWKEHSLTWSGDPVNRKGGRHDTGGKLLIYFLEHDIEWYRLRRTASLTKHPVWFTIYDNLIYHHGAGSRGRGCRAGNKGLSFNENKMFAKIANRPPYEDFTWDDHLCPE